MSCNNDCSSIGAHELVDCGLYPKGGISTIGLLECNKVITDYTSGTQWQTELTAGRLILMKNIKGEIPDPSPVEGENPLACGSETVLDNFERTITWTDFNVTSANIDFYNSLNRRTYYVVAYHCDNSQVEVVLNKCTFEVMLMTPKTNKEKRKFTAKAKWIAFDQAQLYDLDATGITLWS